ncbi:MAG: hypothetical protein ABR974_10320 [Bacteroidales bacterium]|jgi:hypothetical protein
MNSRKRFLLMFLIVARISVLNGQADNPASFLTNTRYSFYSGEKRAEILVHIPADLRMSHISVLITFEGRSLNEWRGIPGKEIISLGFALNDSIRSGTISTEIDAGRDSRYHSSCELIRLIHKPNEVKTDRLTGGMIVNGRQFFPFGFYCYSPVYPTLPEEEVVKGFNMISPYQKILPGTLNQRKAYMDRCASLGMKVHYNLLSVSGGGGVESKTDSLTKEQKRSYLINEIKTFRDHPALLAWYIADEPTGNKVSPDEIEEIYGLVKNLDPWHPVSVVFMAPFLSARKFSDGTDIVMADPYPVPDRKVSMVGAITGALKKEFTGEKPVWIVPQAFGGGELWSREPSLQEVRSMTWQAIIKGATGIQYFIRLGLSSFPKSAATWNECGRMAFEVSSLTPWLLSDEESIDVNSDSKNILAASRMHHGQLVIMAVNTGNEPSRIQLRLNRGYSGKADVIFENREIRVTGGIIYDYIPALGTLVYKIDMKPEPDSIMEWKGNMITDPGFEYMTSPGVPTSCYVSGGGDRGATFCLDPREHVEGNYSLRLQTPVDGKSISLKLFPITVNTGSSYLVSLWAKSDPEQRFQADDKKSPDSRENSGPHLQYTEVGLGDFGTASFVPVAEWRQYIAVINVPADTVPTRKTNVILRMPGQGVAWFDMIQVVEDPINKEKGKREK